MAVLGLRSLYFTVAGIIDRFYYLRFSVSLVLVAVGTKMLLKDVLHTLPDATFYTLGAIAFILASGIVGSIVRARRTPESVEVEVPARRERVVKVRP
jgi:tellurite resistance protein TerC